MTVFECRGVWAPKLETADSAWVLLKEHVDRIALVIDPGISSARTAYLERDQARCLARQLNQLARLGDKRAASK